MTVEFCYIFFVAVDYYLIVRLIIPHFFDRKKYFYFFALSLLLILVSTLLRVWVAGFMNIHFFLVGREQPGFINLFGGSFLNIFIWVQLLVAAKMVLSRIRNQQYVAMIEQEKTRNELNFLKAQVNPHFLFNSLNSIYGHIDRSNHTARNILLKFSEILRYQLYECGAEKIKMESEIQYIQNYIALERYRKEESLIVELSVDQSLNDLNISPLLLLVFVENAFKYVGVSGEQENKLSISLCRKESWLCFSVVNSMDEGRNDPPSKEGIPEKSKGIGLANVRRRLEMLYPAKHRLSVNQHRSSFEVVLDLDLS
jgi:LytS/YehU family sensor histidine kinase